MVKNRVKMEATDCSFALPHGIAVDEKTHTCFIAEYGSSRIKKLHLLIESITNVISKSC
jgi:hypothetical protein